MPKQNPYYIKNIENLPKVEQVVYLDQNYQPQSYEEFLKTYESSEKVEILTEAEWKDRVLYGPQYGPGVEQSKTVISAVAKTTVAVGAAGAIIATGGAATPLILGGVAAGAGGEVVRRIARDNDNEVFEWIGDTVCSTGINLITGGLGSATGAVSTTRSLASNVARETAKNAREGYEAFSLVKDSVEFSIDYAHAQHKDKGISYKSDCRVCNKNLS